MECCSRLCVRTDGVCRLRVLARVMEHRGLGLGSKLSPNPMLSSLHRCCVPYTDVESILLVLKNSYTLRACSTGSRGVKHENRAEGKDQALRDDICISLRPAHPLQSIRRRERVGARSAWRGWSSWRRNGAIPRRLRPPERDEEIL